MNPTDTEMLDWLEKQGFDLERWQFRVSCGSVFLSRNTTSEKAHKTAREAIQLAMATEDK
jgi:virulence-associated protein VapD